MNFYKDFDKGAIVIAHFGTTHKDTREKTIDVINEKVKNKFKKLDFFQVFTSRIINRILLKRGIENLNTNQMLEKLKNAGYKHILIQPTYIINGTEMEALKREVEQYSEFFEDIRVGKALLSNVDDYIGVINIIEKNIGELEQNEGIVLVGHGTDHPALATYPMLDHIARDLEKPIYIGTLEGYPSLETVIKQLKKDNKNKVKLMPLMFVAGDHAKNDIAVEWKETLESEGFEVELNLKGLGEIEEIQDMFIDKIKTIEENQPEDILIKKIEYSNGKECVH